MDKNIIETGRNFLYLNTLIHISDNSEVIIENCKKILEYNDIFLKVRTANLDVQIWGEDLRIHDYKINAVIVNGKISSIELFPKLQVKER